MNAIVIKSILKKLIILLLWSCMPQLLIGQWVGGTQNERAVGFVQGANQLYFLANTRSYGAGSEDFWLLKYNENMQRVFQTNWGFLHYDLATDILYSSDDHFLVCGYSWDAPGGRTSIVVNKYNKEGDLVWTSYFGGYHNDVSFAIKETLDGSYLITGIDRGYGSLGAVFLVKIDKDGLQRWSRYYDSPHKDVGMDIAICKDSSLLILASTNAFVGQIANSSEYLSPDAADLMLIKTDPNGEEQWRRKYGGSGHDFAQKIITDGKDYFYVFGSSMDNSYGSFDMILQKFDINGGLIWRKNYGGSGYEYGNNIDINEAGELLLSGTSSSFSNDENPDIYVVKTDSSGQMLWQKTYGGSASDYGKDAQFMSDGNLIVMGSSTSGDANKLDLYIVKTNAAGNIIQHIEAPILPNDLGLEAFPNPTHAYVRFKYKGPKGQSKAEFILYDSKGSVIQSNTLTDIQQIIPFKKSLSKGVYLYAVKLDDEFYAGKIIIN